jgi:VWFA-related protein
MGLMVTALSFAYTTAGRGQTTIQANVNEVLVPVVVTDKAGHHVTGMHASDFHIAEDGVPQDLVSLTTSTSAKELVSVPHSPSVPANTGASNVEAAPPSSPKRTYLICIDTLHSSFSNFGRVRKALQKFFDKEEAGDSQYALFALGRQIQVIQDSTRDSATILAAIASKNFMKTVNQIESAKLAHEVQQFTYFMRDFYCDRCACEAYNTTDTPLCLAARSRLRGYLLGFSERARILDENFYQALQNLVTAIGSMPTTRTILLISDGFNRFPGRELYAVMSGFDPKDHQFEFNPRDTNDRLQNILKIAVNNDICIPPHAFENCCSILYRIGVTANCSCILRFDAGSSEENKTDGRFKGNTTFDSH